MPETYAHPNSQAKIAILGSGSWGSTLAWLLATNNRQVSLWTSQPEKAELLVHTRKLEHPVVVNLPDSIDISSNLERSIHSAEIILFCCNSQSMREVSQQVSALIRMKSADKPVLVSAAKGLELSTLCRMSEILRQTNPNLPICALSGPNLAAEILKGMPTASVIACQSKEVAYFVQKQMTVSTFRLYSNTDIIGVELGGTLKNVIAIAAGASDGLNLGVNAKAALLTRGLAEMTRLACALGAQRNTLSGLAGMGDLFATCSSPLSRNYRMGQAMASGLTTESALQSVQATAEGIPTAEAVCELSQKLGIEMPIAEQVEATLKGKTTPKQAIMSLMARPLSSE